MKKILDIFYSTRLTAVLFIVYSIAMGVATFIENDYGTQTAKALVYNAWWFEAIMVFFDTRGSICPPPPFANGTRRSICIPFSTLILL